jgi:hypothetical protein
MTAPLVFITGASSGIGQALAAEYARAGWRLALVARHTDVLHDWARAQGLPAGRVAFHAADVREPDQIIGAARRCLAEQGLPDVVIAAAGISVGIDTAERADLAVMQDTFATNNLGMAATFHAFITPMRAVRRGTLVGIASMAAIRGLPGHGAYCASKAAVVNYCESLRVELRGAGVRVVTILPGFIDTPMTRGNPYWMPFLMPAERFAIAAMRATGRGARRAIIPWPMALVALLLRAVPGSVYDRVIAGRGRKPRRSGEHGIGPLE